MTRKSQRSLLLTGVSAVAGLGFLARQGVAEQSSSVDIELGDPQFGGTGCPSGTVLAVLSPDKTRLSISFDRYVAETGPGQRRDRKSCNIVIPVHIGPGLSVSMLEVAYRGAACIPPGGRGGLSAESFFAGSPGQRTTRSFPPGFCDDFVVEDAVDVAVWTSCGEDTNARVTSSIFDEKSAASSPQETYVALGTVPDPVGIELILQWRRCID